jgi:nitrate reductase NapE
MVLAVLASDDACLEMQGRPASRGRYSHQPRDMPATDPSTRRDELAAFLFFAILMAPLLAVTIVGTYGFAVWMTQLIAGPPAG